jgi:predicted nucleic acid-binding protein
MKRGDVGVIVDSHIWIEFLSGEKSPRTAEVDRLIRSDAIRLVGPVIYEVLVGPRKEAHRQYLQGRLRAFELLATNDTVWSTAVDLGRLEGVAKRRVPFSDVLIAAHAIEHECSVFTDDPHFDVFPQLNRHRSSRGRDSRSHR